MSNYSLDPSHWSPGRVDKVNRLFDLLVPNMGRFTPREEICQQLDIKDWQVYRVVHDLRITLGSDQNNTDTVISRHGLGGGYQITSDYEVARPWWGELIASLGTQVETNEYQFRPMVRGTDGRTVDGKKARIYEMKMRHIREELALIDMEQDA